MCKVGRLSRLLLLKIIINSKNWTISIIGNGNITINRQNQLIVYTYYIHISPFSS